MTVAFSVVNSPTPSVDTSLSMLALSGVDLEFDPAKESYQVAVGSAVTALIVAASPSDAAMAFV